MVSRGGEDGDGDGGGEGEQVLLQGGATMSSAIAASIDGERVNGIHIVFLNVVVGYVVQVQPKPIVAHHPLSDPFQMDPPLRGLPLKTPLGQLPKGPPQKVSSLYPTLVYNQVMLVPQTTWSSCPKLGDKSTSSTNELNTAYSVSTATGHSSQAQGSSSYADELMFLFFANQSSTSQLDKEDLEQIDQDDLEEIDLKWQVAMLSIRVKQFYKKTRRKLDCRSARNSGNMSIDAVNAGYRGRDNDKRPAKEEDEKALVVQDGLGTYNWSYQVEGEAYDFALMAFTSNPSSFSSSNFEISEKVTSLTKDEKDAPETSTAYVEKSKEDRFSAPLIEDWETDSDDDSVFTPEPIPAKIDFVKADESVKHVKLVESVKHVKPVTPVKTTEQTEKSKNFSSSPKVDKKN
nr:hypothetical protein [Tanacetum cinerariifolium]